MAIGIYKITNQINGKVYIGQSIHIKQRWKEHISDAIKEYSDAPIHRAIRKYGKENFLFEIIEECDQQELNDKERYWISHFNSTVRGNGYNLTYGGDCNNSLVDYQTIYELWDKGYTTGKIVEYFQSINTPINRSTVLKYLKDYKNYSTHESRSRANKERAPIHFKKKCNHIYQYNLDGTFVNEWGSVFEITDYLDITDVCIYDCINGKQLSSGGFQWKAEKYEKIDNIWGKTNYPLPVNCYDLSHNFIATYSSTQEAADIVKGDRKNIVKVCKKEEGRKSAYGYIWEYAIDNWQEILKQRSNKDNLKEKAIKLRKVERPTREELKMLIRKTPFTTIAKQYGVTAPAIRNWCENYELPRTKQEINSYSDKEWENI